MPQKEYQTIFSFSLLPKNCFLTWTPLTYECQLCPGIDTTHDKSKKCRNHVLFFEWVTKTSQNCFAAKEEWRPTLVTRHDLTSWGMWIVLCSTIPLTTALFILLSIRIAGPKTLLSNGGSTCTLVHIWNLDYLKLDYLQIIARKLELYLKTKKFSGLSYGFI